MLPASAGMILDILARQLAPIMGIRAPRIRGDDPGLDESGFWTKECSPHPRG